MSQLAQPVPPPPPPPPAGVIVCAPAAAAPAAAGQVCDASPPAGPSPPALPSPPQLHASLSAQEAPLDLSAAAATAPATAEHRLQEPVQKVKVEQPKQERDLPLDQGSNILRSQLNMQREMHSIPTPEQEKMEYNDRDTIARGPDQKRWKPDAEPQYPGQGLQRVALAEEPSLGCHLQRAPHMLSGSQYREKLFPQFQHQAPPLPPRHHTLPSPTYATLEPRSPPRHPREGGYMTPIHVQIPSYPLGPVPKKLPPVSYPGDCSPQHGSAFSRHPRSLGPLPSADHDSEVRRMNYQAAWALMDSEQRKPEVLTISMLMQPTPSSAVPPMVPPQMARYSPNQYRIPPHAGRVLPLPHWGPTNWMTNPGHAVPQASPPEVSSAEAAVASPPSAMAHAQSQAQGKTARPFKAFNYDEHLGEPVTHEGKLGRLPSDTRENYENFLRNKRAQLPSPSIDFKARKNAQSPEGDQPSSTEENADVAAYKARRQKNNLAAKRSRAARHIKEDDIAITSMYFCELIKEYRHSLGVQKLLTQHLERQLASTYSLRQ